jgi:hypothetical protein
MKIIKSLACVALAVLLGGGSAFAASTQCRSIQSRKERNACYERQAEAAKQKQVVSGDPKMIDSIEAMKLEDDRLTKRLQGICRGC